MLEGERRDRLMRNLLGLRIVLTSLGVGIAIAFAAAAGYRATLVLGAAVLGVSLLAEATQATFAIPLYTTLLIGRQVFLEQLRQATNVGLIIALVALGTGVLPFLAVPLPTGLALLAGTIVLSRRMTPLRPSFDVTQWRGVLRQTLPVALSGAVHTLYLRSVILTMSLISTALQTGYFATSYRLVEVLVGVPVLLVGTVFPVLARSAQTDAARLRYGVQRMFEAGVAIGMWLAVCTALGAHLAISVIAGRAGLSAVPVLRIQAAVVGLAFLSTTLGFALLSLRRHRELVAASGLAFAVTLTLAFVLVGSLGARGGAIATVSGETALVLTLGSMLRRARRDVSPSLSVVPRVAVAGVVAAAGALIVGGPDILRVALFSAAYAAALVLLRAFPREIGRALLEPLRGR